MRVQRAVSGVFAVAMAVSLVLASATAEGFCVNKKQGALELAVWKKPVPYFVSDTVTDPAMLAAIDAAFAAWGGIECSTLRFRKGGSFAIGEVPFQFHRKYAIYVFFHTDVAAFPADAQYVSTSSHGIDVSGLLKEASIALNGATYKWSADGSPGIDIKAELMRVIAEVIGLEVSDVSDSVTRDPPGDGRGKLSDDDVAAVRYLYYKDGCGLPKVPDSSYCSDGGGAKDPKDPSPDPGPGPGAPSPLPPRSIDGCSTSADCADGLQCSAGSCVSAAKPPFGSGGCSAARGERIEAAPLWLVLLLLVVVIGRRRIFTSAAARRQTKAHTP